MSDDYIKGIIADRDLYKMYFDEKVKVVATQAAQIEALSESLRSAMAYIADKNGFDQNGRRGDETLNSVGSHNGYRFNYSDADFLLNAVAAVGEKTNG